MIDSILIPPFLWYILLLFAMGFVALPFAHILFHRSRIAWFAASKALGLALLNYAAWMLAHSTSLPYSRSALWVLFLVMAGLSVCLYTRYGNEMLARFRKYRIPIIVGEVLFVAAFAFGAILRAHAPEIRDQEKFMDMAFLNSLESNAVIPPGDPWRYELPINYYYGGYMQMATLAKMTAVAPEIAYNLSAALILGLAALLAFAAAFEITPRIRWALVAVCAVLLMSNLDIAVQNLEYFRKTEPDKAFSVDWWRPSRVIYDGPIPTQQEATINEFPFFSIFHSDLHPHMMAIPFVLLFLCALMNLVSTKGLGFSAFGTRGKRWLRLVATAWLLGLLAFVNGFDFISFTAVFGALVLAREWRNTREPAATARLELLLIAAAVLGGASAVLAQLARVARRAYGDQTPPGYSGLVLLVAFGAALTLAALWLLIFYWRRQGRPRLILSNAVVVWLVAMVLSVALYAPFFLNYHAPVSAKPPELAETSTPLPQFIKTYLAESLPFGFVDFRSGAGEFLTMWGSQFLIVLLALSAFGKRVASRVPPAGFLLVAPVVLLAWALLFAWWGHVVAASLLFVALWALLALGVSKRTPSQVFVLVSIAMSMLILFACEQFYIRDNYGRNLQRMNTLFKFYYPVWILLGLAVPFCLRAVLREASWTRARRVALFALALAPMAWAMEYPVWVSAERIRRYEEPTLDGMEYLRRDHPGDYAAILWLRGNARSMSGMKNSAPVILEAVGGQYSYYARVATFSGLRAVLGWGGHESVWRGADPGDIERDAKQIYSGGDPASTLALLKKYRVDLVYVGELERKDFPAEQLERFRSFLPVVYEQDGVVIYRTNVGE